MKISNDKPLAITKKSEIEDALNTKVFAQALSEFISSCETPTTIGIQGDWGSGKTSLMNMISSSLPNKNRIKEISLNTWNYSLFKQDEYLGISIINALLIKVQEIFDRNQKNELVNQSLKALKATANFLSKMEIGIGLPGLGVTTKIADAKESVEGEFTKEKLEFENISKVLDDFKKAFENIVSESLKENERLVIYIDDLDRVRPIKAVEVLEALKLFMDIEKCVFVLAVDYSVVQLGIVEKYGEKIQLSSGKSFFDKIIQLPFNMPTASYEINEYIKKLLEDSEIYKYNFKNNKEDEQFFVNITEVTVGRNPRSIKRAINYAALLEKIRSKNATNNEKKERDTVKLLYAVVCLQIAWPELFEYFILNPTVETIKKLEDWDFLSNLSQTKRLLQRLDNPDDLFDNVSAYFDTLYEILDTSKDGMISNEELFPLLNVLKLVRLISERTIEQSKNPLIEFEENISNNNTRKQDVDYFQFYQNVFKNSEWVQNENIQFKQSRKRYYSIVYNRKQIGSISTLKTRPFNFRLKTSKNKLLELLGEYHNQDITQIIKSVENSTYGIGDTEIGIKELSKSDTKEAKEFLNVLFEKFVTQYNKL